MSFRRGDRVRIRKPASEYTGCRGTIADLASEQPPGVVVLGHRVAIDGENGVTRPFRVDELEPLVPARVRAPAADRARRDADGEPSRD